MGVGGVSVTFVIGIRFNDSGIRKVFFKQGLHPFAGNDIGPVLLTGVEFYPNLSANITVHFLISGYQSFGRQITGKVNNRFFSVPLGVGDILVAILDG